MQESTGNDQIDQPMCSLYLILKRLCTVLHGISVYFPGADRLLEAKVGFTQFYIMGRNIFYLYFSQALQNHFTLFTWLLVKYLSHGRYTHAQTYHSKSSLMVVLFVSLIVSLFLMKYCLNLSDQAVHILKSKRYTNHYAQQ